MRRYLSLYLAFVQQRLKSLLEYRVSFLIGAASQFIEHGIGVLLVLLAAAGLHVVWTPLKVVYLVLAALSGAGIVIALT